MKKLWDEFSLFFSKWFYIRKYKKKFEKAKFSYSEKDIENFAKREYKRKFIKGLITFIRTTLITVGICSIGFATNIVDKVGAVILSVFTFFSEDAWLGFLGNVMGSAVAILGVYITIRFERKKTEKEELEKIKPIILFTDRQIEEENQSNTHQIRLYDYKANKEDIQTVEYADYIIRNVGYAAINLKIGAVINGVAFEPDKIINYLPANDYIIIKMSLEISKKQYRSLFQRKEPQNSFIVMYNDIKGNLYTDTYKGFASYEKAGEDYNLKMKITT